MVIDARKYQYIDELYENIAVLNTDTSMLQHNVYLAVNRVTGKAVIKKIIGIDIVPIYMLLQKISSPHLATIYDCAQNGWSGIVIEEYIEGMTLESYIQNKGMISEKEAYKIIANLCDVLELVHNACIVHRDINPKNIIISKDNVLKLIDFDIARKCKENSTQDTTILGTLGYAAPEQFGFSQTDARTDIYALGVLLNELLTGKLPNEYLCQKTTPKRVIQKCTRIDPCKRFQSVSALKKRLHKGVLSWFPKW